MWVLTTTVVAAELRGVEFDVSKRADSMYINEAYGKLVGFLYGWSFAVIQTGTIAAVSCSR
jgi:APA family basic amino acid/polyamine antiporter